MTAPLVEKNSGTSAEIEFAELVEELTAKFQAGEPVDVEAFLACCPEQAERMRRLLPALRMLGAMSKAGVEGLSFSPAEPDGAAGTGKLGDFRIIREVGRGGMGIVYEAQQVSLGRRVALKLLPFAATLDARQLQRFQNEARAAACLHHTNIVPVHYVGSERGVHYYAMQFIEGHDLASLVSQLRAHVGGMVAEPDDIETVDAVAGKLVEGTAGSAADTRSIALFSTERSRRPKEHYRTVARLGIQAAEALDHAHQQGIVHRDVKPANLLVDTAGQLWITDFGLAQMQSDNRLTMTGDLLGTLRYMSPEQALAKRVIVDHRTDVYSLGATLYEVLTLEPAFAGGDRQELLRQIAFEEPVAPRKLDRAIPAELETIVLKAMEKSPAVRYPTAQELADDLRRWLEDRPIKARRPSLRQVTARWIRRRPTGVALIAVSALLAGVLLAEASIHILRLRVTVDEARAEAARAYLLAECRQRLT
jgi:serine/threonine protein kinase